MSAAREVASTTMWATVMGSSGPPSAAAGTTYQWGQKTNEFQIYRELSYVEEGNLGNFHELQEGGRGALLLSNEHGSKSDSQLGPSHDRSCQSNTADHHSLDTDQEHIQQGTPRRHEAVLAVGVKV